MGLAGMRGLGQGVERVRRGCEARVTGLEAEDALAGGLGLQQSLADLDDLAEGELVERVGGRGFYRGGRGFGCDCGGLEHGRTSGHGRRSVAGSVQKRQEVMRESLVLRQKMVE